MPKGRATQVILPADDTLLRPVRPEEKELAFIVESDSDWSLVKRWRRAP